MVSVDVDSKICIYVLYIKKCTNINMAKGQSVVKSADMTRDTNLI